jgi:hypothetical protein
MPPIYPPVAAAMSVEAGVMAIAAASLSRLPVFWRVGLTILCGRMAAFGSSWILAQVFQLPAAFASTAVLIQGLPGVALQLAVVPLLLKRLARREGNLFR